mmetsp:Transcript_1974/g.4520  ORF Transcript_1974/g.4520 Transcript_1974/m.4520 type:complete len:215 (-) Transcript_1974:536-1180(-)
MSSPPSMPERSVFERLRELLETEQAKEEITFSILEHEAAYTSEESARVRGTSLSSGAKALIVKLSSKRGGSATAEPQTQLTASASANTVEENNINNNDNNNDNSFFVMFVIPADRKFATKQVKKQIEGIKNLRFATKEEVYDVTNGLTPGSIPPFGKSLFGTRIRNVYCDQMLADEDTINFNAGDHSRSISITFDDYCKVENPILGKFTVSQQS